MIIELINISKNYVSSSGLSQKALDEVSFCLQERGLTVITGESGCGKTTLINILGGLIRETSGVVKYDGKKTADFSESEWDKLRNEKIGFVLQNYALIENETVERNLRYVKDGLNMSESEYFERKDEVLSAVGMSGCEKKRIYELSGGQKQRISIARALLKRPEIILADEPTGNLDSENSRSIFSLLKSLSTKCLVLMVSHDLRLTREFADREIQLKDGKVCADLEFDANEAAMFLVTTDEGNTIRCNSQERLTEVFHAVEKENIRRHASIDFFPAITDKHPEKDEAQTFQSKKMHFKTRTLCALENIRFGLKRVLPASCCIIIACFLLFSLISIIFNDYPEAVLRYIEKYDVKLSIAAEKHRPGARNKLDSQINCGKKLYDDLKDVFGEDAIGRCVENVCFSSYITGIAYYDEAENSLPADKFDLLIGLSDNCSTQTLLCGHFPESSQEIIITDYVAAKAGLTEKSLGNEFYLGNKPIKLVGIIKTDFQDYQPDLHLSDADPLHNEAVYLMKVKYCVGYVYDEYWPEYAQQLIESKKIITYAGANLLDSMDINKYVGLSVNVTDASKLGMHDLCPNEVVVSRAYAESHGLDEKDFPKQYYLKNLYSDVYYTSYYDRINFSDYVTQEVSVIGFTDNNDADIYVANSVFEELTKDKISFYNFDFFTVNLSKDRILPEKLKECEERNLILNDPNLVAQKNVKALLEEYKTYGLFLTGVIVILIIGVYWMFMTYEIKANRGKIGIMRILGADGKTLARIYAEEGIVLTIVCIALSLVSSGIILSVVNSDIFVREQVVRTYPIVVFDGLNMTVTILGLLLGIGLVTYSAIKLVARKELFSLLHE